MRVSGPRHGPDAPDPWPPRHALDELVEYRRWANSREPATQTWPALKKIAPAAPRHRGDVDVGQDHDRRLAAELQRHPLQRVGRIPLIILPISVEPVKAILSTSGWRTSPSPAVWPLPVMMLTTPAGKPASLTRSARLQRGHRGLLGRLEDEGAARRQRRRDLQRRHDHREVPRHDLGGDADRLAPDIGMKGPRRRRHRRHRLAAELGRPAGHVVQHAEGGRDIERGGHGLRLAVVDRLELGEFVGMRLDQVRRACGSCSRARSAAGRSSGRRRTPGAPRRRRGRRRRRRRRRSGRSPARSTGRSTASVLSSVDSTHSPSMNSRGSRASNSVAAAEYGSCR